MECEGQRLSPVSPSGAAEELWKFTKEPNLSHLRRNTGAVAGVGVSSVTSASSSSTATTSSHTSQPLVKPDLTSPMKRNNPLTNISSFMEIENPSKRRRKIPEQNQTQSTSTPAMFPSLIASQNPPIDMRVLSSVSAGCNHSQLSSSQTLPQHNKKHQLQPDAPAGGGDTTHGEPEPSKTPGKNNSNKLPAFSSLSRRPDPPADLASALAGVNLASPKQKAKECVSMPPPSRVTSTSSTASSCCYRMDMRKDDDDVDLYTLNLPVRPEIEVDAEVEGDTVLDLEDQDDFYWGLTRLALYKRQHGSFVGITTDSTGDTKLHQFLHVVRIKYQQQSLDQEQLAILEAMGFPWKDSDDTTALNQSDREFHSRLVQLAHYKNRNTNASSSSSLFPTQQSSTTAAADTNDQNLQQWVEHLQAEYQYYKSTGVSCSPLLTSDRIALLQTMGVLPLDEPVRNNKRPNEWADDDDDYLEN